MTKQLRRVDKSNVNLAATPATTTPVGCVHTHVEIKTKIDDLNLAGTPAGLTAQVFTPDGWPFNVNGNKNVLAISLDSEVAPILNEIYFKINGVMGTPVAVNIETSNGTRIVEEVCLNRYFENTYTNW